MRKVSNTHRMIAQCPVSLPNGKFCQYWQKTLEKQKLNFSRCALFHVNTRVSFKHFVSYSRIGLFTPFKKLIFSIISIIKFSLYNLYDGYKFDIMYKDSVKHSIFYVHCKSCKANRVSNFKRNSSPYFWSQIEFIVLAGPCL